MLADRYLRQRRARPPVDSELGLPNDARQGAGFFPATDRSILLLVPMLFPTLREPCPGPVLPVLPNPAKNDATGLVLLCGSSDHRPRKWLGLRLRFRGTSNMVLPSPPPNGTSTILEAAKVQP